MGLAFGILVDATIAVEEVGMTAAILYNWNELHKESPRHGIERVAFRGDNAMVVLN